MMSQYGNMSYYIDNVETTDVSYESALLSMQQDLAEGNYLLYNQYSNETEQSEVLNEYGQRNFDLTSRYLDYGVFDSDGEQLLDNVGETTAQLLMTDDEESAGYEFRVRYTFSSIGELASIQVDGTALDPEKSTLWSLHIWLRHRKWQPTKIYRLLPRRQTSQWPME